MEKERREIRLGKDYRGVKVSLETQMVIEYLKSMEDRIDGKFDEQKKASEKTHTQMQLNKEQLIEHSGQISHLESDNKRNFDQHDKFFSNFVKIEERLNIQAGKSSTIPIIISVVSVLIALAALGSKLL